MMIPAPLTIIALAGLAAIATANNLPATNLFKALPKGYNPSEWVHIDTRAFAYNPGSFNRSVWSAVWDGTASDPTFAIAFRKMASSKFIAYDERFFDLAGPNASIKQIAVLPQMIHEAPSWIPETNQLLFTEWGPINGTTFAQHPWQWLMDLDEGKNYTKYNVTFDPPAQNLHGSMYFDGKIYGCTDGGNGTYASIIEIDPIKRTTKYLMNNWYGHPMAGFNEIFVDLNGNFWVSDAQSAYTAGITPYAPGNPLGTFFVNRTSLVVNPVGNTEQKGNGIGSSPDGKHFYALDTGAFEAGGVLDPLGPRTMTKYDIVEGNALTNPRILATPISYSWDGIRASRKGWIVGAASEGVDIVDPVSGVTIGTFHVGTNITAVNIAFRPGGYIYVVGKGGAWEIRVQEEMAWEDSRYTGQW